MIKANLLWTILWMFWSVFYGFLYQPIRINLLFKKTQIHNNSFHSKHTLHPLHSLNRDGRCKFLRQHVTIEVAGYSARHNYKRYRMSTSDCASHFCCIIKSCPEILQFWQWWKKKKKVAQHFCSIVQSDLQHIFSA